MAEVEEAIVSLLGNDAALTALVADRIYNTKADEAPGDPYLVFQELSDIPVNTHDGITLTTVRFKFSAWSHSAIKARDVRSAVKDVLLSFRGDVLGVNIQTALKVNQQSFWDDKKEFFRATVDIRVTWREGC